MIKNRPEKDTVNPPGQFRPGGRNEERHRPVRYLRDVIQKYQEEDKLAKPFKRAQEAAKGILATYPSTDAEKRPKGHLGPLSSQYLKQYGFVHWQAQEVEAKLERLKQALLRLVERSERQHVVNTGTVLTSAVRRILEENT